MLNQNKIKLNLETQHLQHHKMIKVKLIIASLSRNQNFKRKANSEYYPKQRRKN